MKALDVKRNIHAEVLQEELFTRSVNCVIINMHLLQEDPQNKKQEWVKLTEIKKNCDHSNHPT